MRTKKTKKLREKDGPDKYSGEQSPYWDWVNNGNIVKAKDGRSDWEPYEANPDKLSEEDSLYHCELSDEAQEKLQAIQDAMPLLTELERSVVLLLYGGMSLMQAAKKLKTSKSDVQQLLSRARKKIMGSLAIRNAKDGQ